MYQKLSAHRQAPPDGLHLDNDPQAHPTVLRTSTASAVRTSQELCRCLGLHVGRCDDGQQYYLGLVRSAYYLASMSTRL